MFAQQLYVIRHGQTDWNAERRLQGQADIPVNAKGRQQAASNGKMLAGLIGKAEGWDFVASPLGRTRETMEILRAAMGLEPGSYRTDDRLREVHFGDWQGHTFAELEAAKPGSTLLRNSDKWNFRPPGADAESYGLLQFRIGDWFLEARKPSIVVAHGGTVRCLFRIVGGMDEKQASNIDIPQDRILQISGGEIGWV